MDRLRKIIYVFALSIAFFMGAALATLQDTTNVTITGIQDAKANTTLLSGCDGFKEATKWTGKVIVLCNCESKEDYKGDIECDGDEDGGCTGTEICVD